VSPAPACGSRPSAARCSWRSCTWWRCRGSASRPPTRSSTPTGSRACSSSSRRSRSPVTRGASAAGGRTRTSSASTPGSADPASRAPGTHRCRGLVGARPRPRPPPTLVAVRGADDDVRASPDEAWAPQPDGGGSAGATAAGAPSTRTDTGLATDVTTTPEATASPPVRRRVGVSRHTRTSAPRRPRDLLGSLRQRLAAPAVVTAGRTRTQIETDLLSRLVRPVPGSAVTGWVVTLPVTAVAAVLRLLYLGRPGRLVFDETYYVKQALSLLQLGYEGDWVEYEVGDESRQPNERFAAGDYSQLSTEADYVVHPAVGKWMIAAGMRLLGTNDPVSWRGEYDVVGSMSMIRLVRAARRLFASTTLGATAGLLLAIDGNHLVMSRISILDVFLSFWALVAFVAVLVDRDSYRRRLAAAAAVELAEEGRY